MKISTGLPLFNTPVDPQGTENQPDHAIFWAGSTSLTSHVIDVTETPIIIKAYGFLNDASTITVCTATTGRGNSLSLSPMVLNGHTVQLSKRNNVLVIDLTGKYYFVLSDGLGQTFCFYHESGLPLWSYGLSAYAAANGMLQFIETQTVKPVVSENQVREYAKLSADSGNLIQLHGDPNNPTDPSAGLYYGINPPASFINQYVSSSTGSNNPLTNDGSQAKPWKSIQYALKNLPDGTLGFINLKAGDTFLTYLIGSTGLAVPDPAMTVNGIIPGHTLLDAEGLIFNEAFNIGNRTVYFTPYNDPAIDAIKQYPGYDPYVARETVFPIIKFVAFLSSDSGIYLPSFIQLGVAGSAIFRAITIQTPITGVASPTTTWGCFPGNGSISMEGGNIKLSGIEFLGGQNATGVAVIALSQVQVSGTGAPEVQIFNNSSSYLSIVSSVSSAYSSSNKIVPALPYTYNADNVQTYLAPKSFWKNIYIYSRTARSYKRVATDIVIGTADDPFPGPQ